MMMMVMVMMIMNMVIMRVRKEMSNDRDVRLDGWSEWYRMDNMDITNVLLRSNWRISDTANDSELTSMHVLHEQHIKVVIDSNNILGGKEEL
jgi:hypothetical protein